MRRPSSCAGPSRTGATRPGDGRVSAGRRRVRRGSPPRARESASGQRVLAFRRMVSGRAPRVPARRRTGQAAEAVEVTIPAKPEVILVARLTAATVAGRLGCTYYDTEYLEIAVSAVS